MKKLILFLSVVTLLTTACDSGNSGKSENSDTQMRGIAAMPGEQSTWTREDLAYYNATGMDPAGRFPTETIIDKNLDTITLGFVQVEKSVTVTYLVDSPTRKVSKYVKPTEPPPVVVDPPVAGYQLTFQTNFDKASDIKNATSDQAGNGIISTSQFTTAPASFYSIPAEKSSGFRSEVQYESAAANPAEGAIEYDVYYDVLVASGGHSMQWHPYTPGASASPGLLHEGGKFTIMKYRKSGNQYIRTGVIIPTKRWVKMRWEFKFGNSGAYLRLFMDGKQIVNDVSGWLGDGSGQYPKIGWNGFDKSTLNSRIYYDNLKVFKKTN